MANLTNVNISPILREMGDKDWDTKQLVNSHPLLTSIEKDTSAMSGDYWKIPVQYSNPTGRSHSSTFAVANRTPSKYKNFNVTPVTDYLNFALDGIVVRKAANSSDRTSFVNALKQEVFSALQMTGNNIAKESYGNIGAARGQAASFTGATITLGSTTTGAVPSQSVNFAAGMVLRAASTDGTSGALETGSITLIAVDLGTGVLTASANIATGIPTFANNMYLFQIGDFGAAAAGLDAWNPSAAPSATTFFGVDRTPSPNLLAGLRYDGVTSGDSMETVFISADALLNLQDGTPFTNCTYFINPVSMGSLRVAKEGQRLIDTDNEYGLGIKTFITSSGHKLVEDRDCPQGVARCVAKGHFWWLTNGNQPALAETDGIEMRYTEDGDTYSAQVVIDHNFGSVPAGLARIALPSS
jgi:hypothetical protein